MVRLIGEALAELNELGVRKAGNWGGFAGGFAADALASVLRRRLDTATTSDEGPVVFEFSPPG